MRPRWLTWAALAMMVFYILLTLFDAYFVQVEKDEGFYAYAFRLVANGKLPYRDFSYIESPALPYYYASLLAGPGITLLSVRLLCAMTGLAGLLILVWCAARSAGNVAASVAALLLFANAAQAKFFACDVTYPLITFLLALAIAAELSSWSISSRMAVQGILLALVGAAKASMGLVSLVWLGGLLWCRRRDRRAVTLGIVAFLATLVISIGPFLLADPKAFFFNVVTVPLTRTRLYPFMHKAKPLDQWLEYGLGQKIEALRTVILWHVPAVALAFLAWRVRRVGAQRCRGILGEATFPIAGSLVLGLFFHLLLPSPAYPNYLFLLIPTLTLFVALRYARFLDYADWGPARAWALALPVLLCALHLLGGVKTDEVGLQVGTWRHGPQREMTRLTAQIVPPGGRLLTDYLPLAVDADRQVVPGNEGGRNSLIPDLPDDRARAFHILNRKSFLEILLKGQAQGVVLTERLTEKSYGSVPHFQEEMNAALSRRYELVREFPGSVYFVYGRTRLFRLRSAAADPSIPGGGAPPSPGIGAPPSQ